MKKNKVFPDQIEKTLATKTYAGHFMLFAGKRDDIEVYSSSLLPINTGLWVNLWAPDAGTNFLIFCNYFRTVVLSQKVRLLRRRV
ncbi:MAG: hypothetical protein D6772_09405 [Bacteroidetes bacterium]|nr:MAG: hypothetical protein D6772_09405 [Bacteroidota bacterium]